MLLRRLILPAAALLAALSPLRAQVRGTFLPAPAAAMERLVTEEVERQKVPGLTAAVESDGRRLWTRGFGYSDIENKVPAGPETMYRLASVSKTITAVAAMQLHEQGKLDLDAPVQRYVPSFPTKQWPITPRQLGGHLAGIRHYRGQEVESTRRYTSLTEALSIFKDDPLLHEPGSKYLYSSYGFNLLGCAVEGASGQRFLDYLSEHVFGPAGMRRIRDDDQAAIIPNRAQGYRLERGELRNSALADVSNKIPGGGLCATAEDLVAFGQALRENRLMKRATRELMWTSQRTADGKPTNYGIGWSVGMHDGVREVSHGGAQPRVATLLYLQPDRGITVALMSNLEGTKLTDLARKLAAAAR